MYKRVVDIMIKFLEVIVSLPAKSVPLGQKKNEVSTNCPVNFEELQIFK